MYTPSPTFKITSDQSQEKGMGIPSGQAGEVLAQPLFCGRNLHMHTLDYVELNIVATSCINPEKLSKAMLHHDFAIFTVNLVHSVAVSLLAATKPKMRHVTYYWPTLASFPGHSQILSRSCGDKLGEGLVPLLCHGLEMVDLVSM